MNILNVTQDELCALAYSFRQNKYIVYLLFCEALMSFLTLLCFVWLFRCRQMRRIWFLIGIDLKITVFIGFFCYFLGTLNAFFLHSYKFAMFMLDLPPCSYVWNGVNCYFANAFYTIVGVIAYFLFHLALLIERTRATFKNPLKKSYGLLGGFLVFLIVAGSPIPPLSMYNRDSIDFDRPYCSNVTSSSQSKSMYAGLTLIAIDFFVTLFDFALYAFNKRQLKRHKNTRDGFNLNHSYKLRELQISIDIIFPFSVTHTLTYYIQIIFNAYYVVNSANLTIEWNVFFSEMTNMTRILTNFILFLFLIIYKHFRYSKTNFKIGQAQGEADVYFDNFRRMIG